MHMGRCMWSYFSTCHVLRGFRDYYDLLQQIGSGSFGSVHVTALKANGKKLAVKIIKKKFRGDFIEPLLARCDGGWTLSVQALTPPLCRRVQHEVDVNNRLGRSLNIASLYGGDTQRPKRAAAFDSALSTFLVQRTKTISRLQW